MTTYSIQTIDTETRMPWMDAPGLVSYRPLTQDSGRCRFAAVTSDAETLEAALEADAAVIGYDAAAQGE